MGKKRAQTRKAPQKAERLVDGLRRMLAEQRFTSFYEVIQSIPKGKVATYGQVAEAAGYPRAHRLVARFLRDLGDGDLPWQRVVGAGGEIKIRGRDGALQRALLKAEGVTCSGRRVDIARYGHIFDL